MVEFPRLYRSRLPAEQLAEDLEPKLKVPLADALAELEATPVVR